MDPLTIGLGAQILGGIAQPFVQGRQNKLQRKHEIDMYNRQYRDNLDFWNMQNTYNAPQQQMQRLQEAGINKLLPFIKGGSASGGVAAPIATPKQSISRAQSPDLRATASTIHGLMGQIAQINLTKAGTDKTREEIDGLKVANDRATVTWLEERKHVAQMAGDKARVSQYEAALKNMEMQTMAEMRGEAEYQGYGGLGNVQVQKQIQEIRNLQQAKKLIIAQTADINIRNKRMKELDLLLKTMPNNTQALQTVLWMILTK